MMQARKLTADQVHDIRFSGDPTTVLAKRHGVATGTVHGVMHGASYKDLPMNPRAGRANWRTIPPEQIREIRELHNGGKTYAAIARRFGRSETFIRNVCDFILYKWVR